MKYKLFLFDLDDTLLDFKESERLSFFSSLNSLGLKESLDELFSYYQTVNRQLWKLFEEKKIQKDELKIERFRTLFKTYSIDLDPEIASERYLEALPESVVLVKHAKELCEELHELGEIGIVTNGIEKVQLARIHNSPLRHYISFTAVSESCGNAKPDPRFFDYTTALARFYDPTSTIVIGDRLETDILGAKNVNLDSCWFNPQGKNGLNQEIKPTFEIDCLSKFISTAKAQD